MFTSSLQTLCICCSCSCGQDSSDDERVTPDHLRPLLDRDSPSPVMPRPRTYGRKKLAGTAAASAIFGTTSSSPHPSLSPVRAPLQELTSRLTNLNIRTEDYEEESERSSFYGSEDQDQIRTSLAHKQSGQESTIADDASNTSSSSERSYQSSKISISQQTPQLDTPALLPLTDKYEADTGRKLTVESWDIILPAGCNVVKIAEASYAEVYRVTIDGSSSILKVMQLRVPSDEASSQCLTAIEVNSVVSEVRLMNALTEYDGFVSFKDAHLIRGKPCTSLISAHKDPKAGDSLFPDPTTFTENSIFLVIELGDAGEVLEEVKLESIHQVWDVLLDVIVALAIAEAMFQFEHRDLHENNICIMRHRPIAVDPSNSSCRSGRSGFEVTILDYGLSRAKLPSGDIVFYDLENDLLVFQGRPGHPQFDTYRRMRTHLFRKDRSMLPRDWHIEGSKNQNNGATWGDHTPYSNVLWIKYLLWYLKKAFKDSDGDATELAIFELETKELAKLLNPRTLVKNGAFSTAGEIYDFVCSQGWLSPEQVATLTESSSMFLSSSN